MSHASAGPRDGKLLPAPACDLLDRLTAELDAGFTLTDLHGAVVASTAGERAGQVHYGALGMIERSDSERAAANAPAVYQPVRLAGRMAGVLVVHGEPEAVGDLARIAAVAIGMALDFSDAAASVAREAVSPGWLLYRLLRGGRDEARQARIMAAIYGWNLCVQRAALVVLAPPDTAHDAERARLMLDLLRQALGAAAHATPLGQIEEAQWVILLEHEPTQPRGRPRALAQQVAEALRGHGHRAVVGVGEPHLPVNPVAALRRSYREAIYAARLGAKLGDGAGVYELRALGPVAFFAPGGRSRRRMAAVVLDPLRAHPAVLETLRAYLAHDLSVVETAARLGLHRHTVRNHLERAFRLTGLDPRALEGAVQLKLALLVAESDPEAHGRWAAKSDDPREHAAAVEHG